MVNFKINGRELTAPEGTTILDAAEKAGIPIPHLCYLKGLNEIAACRMCMVEVEGTGRLVPSCNTQLLDGMVIQTNSPRVREARKTNLRLILSQHNSNCTVCVRSGYCELQQLSHDLNIHYQPYEVQPERAQIDLRACLKSSNKDGNECKSKELSRNKEYALTIFPKPAEFVNPAK